MRSERSIRTGSLGAPGTTRTSDLQLRKLLRASMVSQTSAVGGASVGHEAAVRVIEAAAAGESPSPADLQTLADLVLELPEVRAALEVREGGPWALARALELAGWVLEVDAGGAANERES